MVTDAASATCLPPGAEVERHPPTTRVTATTRLVVADLDGAVRHVRWSSWARSLWTTAVLLALVAAHGAAWAQTRPRATFAQLSAAASTAREGGRLDEAIALYRRALSLRPAWAEGHWYLGTLLYERNQPREARAAFGRLIRAHPDHAGAIAMDGLCAFQLGTHEDALRLLLRARQLNVERTAEIARVVRYHTGILLTRFGEFEGGNQVLTELVQDQEESPHLVEALGVNVLRQALLPGEVPAGDRERVRMAGQLGYAMAARQSVRVQSLVDQLLTRFGTTPNVHYLAGVAWLAQEPSRALEAFHRELVISPAHVPARLQLAFELVKQGDAEKARRFADQAVALAPELYTAHLAVGQVALGRDDMVAAIAAFERAVRLAPESPQTHYLLAVAYARAGRTADAERERATFSKLNASAPLRR